jgi:hypothetical protein
MKLKLDPGFTGFTDPDTGKWVCTGSMMGRRDWIPDDSITVRKLRLERVPLYGDYDPAGAYWGSGKEPLYVAYGESDTEQVRVFIRAKNRDEAKVQALYVFPNARFFR